MHHTTLFVVVFCFPAALVLGLILALAQVSIPWYVFVLAPFLLTLLLIAILPPISRLLQRKERERQSSSR